MIHGVGIDIVEVERVRKAIEKYGERFTQRVFTPDEIAHCEGKHDTYLRYAARFAAKEAAFKSLRGRWRKGMRWLDFETVGEEFRPPTIRLTGAAAMAQQEASVTALHVSISHDRQYAVAVVVAEKEDPPKPAQ
ncbi:MAG: holo-ACP synthase [bacterium]|nr:holo-ACP synthase [bacterium]